MKEFIVTNKEFISDTEKLYITKLEGIKKTCLWYKRTFRMKKSCSYEIYKMVKYTFPQKEFMLRSTGGIKYFKLGTAMQIILISLVIITGFL